MSDNTRTIWYNDLPHFITEKNYFVILPLTQMTIEDRINAIMRSFLYFGVLMTIIRKNTRYLMFPTIAGLISIALYTYEVKKKVIIETEMEKRDLDIVDNKVCTRVTTENPFMNPSIADLTFNPEKPGACDITTNKIKNSMEDHFNARVFQDVNDIFNNKSSQRQFYTLPSTTIPNDQGGFANWLYNRGPSCKQGNGDQCWRNVSQMGAIGGGGKGGVAGAGK
jgi:hypothetical protein